MSIQDELGKRMKENYESVPKSRLTRRTPVIIRIDGKAFHTLTKGFNKPFDEVLMHTMQCTMRSLCENIQGCVLGYTQSDEISLLLTDYKRHTSEAWFDYEVMKMCSISASMSSVYFNEWFQYFANNYLVNLESSIIKELFNLPDGECVLSNLSIGQLCKMPDEPLGSLSRAYDKGKHAMFDSRCFNIPKEEVTNYFYWRQLDATRNSIEMVGQANFSHKELHKKTCNDIQEMLHEQKGINWNDFPIYQKRGSCCIKTQKEVLNKEGKAVIRNTWEIDEDIPVFSGEGREYIEQRFINIEEE